MREQTFGGLRVRLAGGEDRSGSGTGLLVVLMHGFGAPGTDLVSLWRQLAVSRSTRFAFPEAPLSLDRGGHSRAWWMIDVARLQADLAAGKLRDLTRTVPQGLTKARAAVISMLDELQQELDVPSERVVLGGFSQGAMLACDVALRDKRQLAGLVLMSTTLLAEPEWTPLMPGRAGLRVLQSHGRVDPLLPYPLAERLRDLLVDAGVDVTFVPFLGGHGISGSVMLSLAEFIGRLDPPGE